MPPTNILTLDSPQHIFRREYVLSSIQKIDLQKAFNIRIISPDFEPFHRDFGDQFELYAHSPLGLAHTLP